MFERLDWTTNSSKAMLIGAYAQYTWSSFIPPVGNVYQGRPSCQKLLYAMVAKLKICLSSALRKDKLNM